MYWYSKEEKRCKRRIQIKIGKPITNNRGITLIALIITIIVMLILVAVTVNVAVNSGLFGHAGSATNQWADAQRQESLIGNDNYIKDTVNKYNGERNEATPGIRVTENTEYTSDEKTAIIPAGFTVSGASNEQSIDNGLVIYLIPEGTTVDWTNADAVKTVQETYDQFVWIPIANINDMYMCQAKTSDTECNISLDAEGNPQCTNHTGESAKLMAGRLYATTYGETFDSSLTTQTYVAGSGLREPDILTGYETDTYLGNINSILGTSYTASNFKEELQREYNEIVKSVYENHGFYVGRYETSNITKTDGTAIKSVAGAIPSGSLNWYYMYAQQRDYAHNNNLEVGSTMIQGAAYDQVMKFVNTATYNVKEATHVGHDYSDFSIMPYQTGGRDYSTNYEGTIAYNDTSKNIFDLEGNVVAYTTEVHSNGIGGGRNARGGKYLNDDSASCRRPYDPWYPGYNNLGSVSQLYIK